MIRRMATVVIAVTAVAACTDDGSDRRAAACVIPLVVPADSLNLPVFLVVPTLEHDMVIRFSTDQGARKFDDAHFQRVRTDAEYRRAMSGVNVLSSGLVRLVEFPTSTALRAGYCEVENTMTTGGQTPVSIDVIDQT